MKSTSVHVRRVLSKPVNLESDLARARVLANWLDAKFSFMGVRFGLDAVVGLTPVIGDTLCLAAATYPIWVARRHGLGRIVQARMAFNVLVDWLPGMIPLVGDAIDVAYKANLKNLNLLEAAAERKRRRDVRTTVALPPTAAVAPARLKGKERLLLRRPMKNRRLNRRRLQVS